MRSLAIACVLVVAVVASAVAVVRTHHVRRGLSIELDGVDAERDRIQVEWGKLQIEQSTWAAIDRIERLAVEKLDLKLSRAGSTVIVAAQGGE